MTTWDGQLTHVSLQHSNKQTALSVVCIFTGKAFPYTCLWYTFNLLNVCSYFQVQIHMVSIIIQIYNINSRFKVTVHGISKCVFSILQAKEIYYDDTQKIQIKAHHFC